MSQYVVLCCKPKSSSLSSHTHTTCRIMNESIWTINAHEVPSVYDVVTWNDNSIIEAFERDLHEYERQHYQRQVTPHLPKMNLSAPAALSASTSVVKPTTVSSASTSLQNQSTDSVVKSVSSSERVESSAQEHLTSPGKVNSDRNSARPDDSTSNAFEQWKQQWYTWYDQSCMDPAHRDAYFAQVVDQSAHQPITPSTPVQTSTSESCPAKVESNDTTKPTPAQPEEHLKLLADQALADLLTAWFFAGKHAGKMEALAEIRQHQK